VGTLSEEVLCSGTLHTASLMHSKLHLL